ncbi:unnamed protein product, partial [Rotaria sp. Silwood1]|jgi:hypothetical protein
MLGL